MANCRRCAKCAAYPSPVPARLPRILPSTRSPPSALPPLRACTPPPGVALEDAEAALAEYGRLIAKPARDGSSYGLIFVNAKQDLVAVRAAARTEDYLIEPFIAGVEATCGVLEQSDGSVTALPPIEIVPAEGEFDYTAKYLAKSTQEICPGRFAPEIGAQIMDQALAGASRAVVQRLFPFRLHRVGERADLSRNQYLAGPDQGVALSEGAQGRRASSSPISCRTRSRWRQSARRNSAINSPAGRGRGGRHRPAGAI